LPSIGGRKPHLMVVMQGDEAPRLEGYGPICHESAERLACEGSVSVLTVDKHGVALDLGRSQRLASEAQRRVLAAQDERCQYRGCSWPARFCEPHHLDFWERGLGRTSVKRMQLPCDRHHRAVHEGGLRLVAQQDGVVEALPP
jgi:hypothetical protein